MGTCRRGRRSCPAPPAPPMYRRAPNRQPAVRDLGCRWARTWWPTTAAGRFTFRGWPSGAHRRLMRHEPPRITSLEPPSTPVALQRDTEMVRPDGHAEFPSEIRENLAGGGAFAMRLHGT